MSYRLLLDENVEHEVGLRLENYGHDVEHVDFVPELGKGSTDGEIASYSLSNDRIVLTYDDDFVVSLDPQEYQAVFYCADRSIRIDTLADCVHEISRSYPQSELDELVYVGTEWL